MRYSKLLLQVTQLRQRELAILSGPEIFHGQTGEPCPHEAHHRKAGRLADPADLPIFPLR